MRSANLSGDAILIAHDDITKAAEVNATISGEHGNYCIPEPDTEIPALIKTEHIPNNIWKMFFDGARSKNRFGTRIILIDPIGKIHKFSYRLTWMCTNNEVEYESLCLGLEQPIKMQI